MNKEDSRAIKKLIKLHEAIDYRIKELIDYIDEDERNHEETRATSLAETELYTMNLWNTRIQMIIGIVAKELEAEK